MKPQLYMGGLYIQSIDTRIKEFSENRYTSFEQAEEVTCNRPPFLSGSRAIKLSVLGVVTMAIAGKVAEEPVIYSCLAIACVVGIALYYQCIAYPKAQKILDASRCIQLAIDQVKRDHAALISRHSEAQKKGKESIGNSDLAPNTDQPAPVAETFASGQPTAILAEPILPVITPQPAPIAQAEPQVKPQPPVTSASSFTSQAPISPHKKLLPENTSVNFYIQTQQALAALRAQTPSVLEASSFDSPPDVGRPPVVFSSVDVNKVLTDFYRTALEPFFNSLVALKKNLMQSKEGEEKHIQEVLESLLIGLHKDSQENDTNESVKRILKNLIELLEEARFDDNKVAKEMFWNNYRSGQTVELTGFQQARLIARANSQRAINKASPIKSLDLDKDSQFTISEAKTVFDQLSRSLEPIFFAFFKIISSMEAKDERKEEQIPVRLKEMQKVWTDQEKKLTTAEEGTIEHLFGSYIENLNRFMGSVSMNLGEQKTQDELVHLYLLGSQAQTAIAPQKAYFNELANK